MEKVQRISLPLCRWQAIPTVFGSLDAPDELGTFLVAERHESGLEESTTGLFELGIDVVRAAVPDPGDPDPQRAKLATDGASWEFITPSGRRVIVNEDDTLDVVFGSDGSVNAAAQLLLALGEVKTDGRLPWDNTFAVYTTVGKHRIGTNNPESFMEDIWGTSDISTLWKLRWEAATA